MCDAAYADKVGGEKTIVMVTDHGGVIEQSMFDMKNAEFLLRKLVFAMAVGGNKLAVRLYKQHFEDKPSGGKAPDNEYSPDTDDADWWKKGSED